MELTQALTRTFRAAAEKVSAIVTEIRTMDEALTYTVALCERKQACQLLVAGCGDALSAPAEDLCGRKQQKVIAAPALSEDLTRSLGIKPPEGKCAGDTGTWSNGRCKGAPIDC